MADTKITTVAEELREAAQALREAAKNATRGPWVPYPTISSRRDDESWTISRTWCNSTEKCEPDCGHTVLTTGAEGCEEDSIQQGDVAWICLANPLLAEPLASWLETVADQFDAPPCDAKDGACNGCEWRWDFNEALAVARVLNGTAS